MLSATAATYYIARRQILEDARVEIETLARIGASRLQAFFEERNGELAVLSRSPVLENHYKNVEYRLIDEAEVYLREIGRMLLSLGARSGAYRQLRYVDASGNVLCRVRGGAVSYHAGKLKEADLLRQLKAVPAGHVFTSDILRSEGGSMVRFATPLRDSRGALRGTLIFDCPLAPVYASLHRMGRTGQAYLGPRSGPAVDLARESGSRIVCSIAVRGTPWSAIVAVDGAELLERLDSVLIWAELLGLILCCLAGWILLRDVRLALEPVGDLVLAAEAYAHGRLDARVRVRIPGEIAVLAESFNSMAARLEGLLRALRESEARYRTTVESSPEAIVSLDEKLNVTSWNQRAEVLFGKRAAEAVGRDLSALFSTEDYATLSASLSKEWHARDVRIRARGREGRALDLVVSWTAQASEPDGSPEYFVVLHDQTEARRLQEMLVQTEKMSAMGTLIAGISHELNNPLAAVVGFAEMLSVSEESALGAQDKEDLRCLHESALRCRDIVQGLLSFVRKGGSGDLAQPMAVNELMRATLSLMEYKLVKGDAVTVETDFDPSEPAVAGEPQRLQQILVNLISNACDAMRDRAGPRVIRLRSRASAAEVRLEVEDTGPGIPPAVRERLFEPFFTTKPPGLGTGLGLAISAQLAAEMGGTLRCEEGPEGGARFVARFPPCAKGEARPAGGPRSAVAGIKGRCLVVDDEPEILRLIDRVLGGIGFSAVGTGDFEEARRKVRAEEFDLVVADLSMGGVKGTDLLKEANPRKRPAFLIITGDILNHEASEELARLGVPMLAKPFLKEDFLRAISDALKGRPKIASGERGANPRR